MLRTFNLNYLNMVFFLIFFSSCCQIKPLLSFLNKRGLIRCKNGLKIKIVSANYGRTDDQVDQVCPDGKTDTLTCRSKSSEIKVKWNCNGYATCHHLHATRHFGDLSANISKSLKNSYRCVKNMNNNIKGILKVYCFIHGSCKNI